jgi:hypothetical protein
MIEIAISLAVIAFAMVAIMGILPIGMSVQRDNRQETIINQDASVYMDLIRNGERGMDDLTNYVMAITNYAAQYNQRGGLPVKLTKGYTLVNSTLNNALTSPQFPITNGCRIIGLLSTPKFTLVTPASFISNHVVAWVRSISGPASEKFPQNNPAALELALGYRLITEVAPYGTNFYDPSWILPNRFPTNSLQYTNALSYSNYVNNLRTNLHDIRLTFRWPLQLNGDTGPGRYVFRTMAGGNIYATNDPINGSLIGSPTNLYFFQPRTYVKAQ